MFENACVVRAAGAGSNSSSIKKAEEKEKACCAHDEVHGWLYLRFHVHRCLTQFSLQLSEWSRGSFKHSWHPARPFFDFKFMLSQLWAFLWPLASLMSMRWMHSWWLFSPLLCCYLSTCCPNGEIIVKENCFPLCTHMEGCPPTVFLGSRSGTLYFRFGQHHFLKKTSSFLCVWISFVVSNYICINSFFKQPNVTIINLGRILQLKIFKDFFHTPFLVTEL